MDINVSEAGFAIATGMVAIWLDDLFYLLARFTRRCRFLRRGRGEDTDATA